MDVLIKIFWDIPGIIDGATLYIMFFTAGWFLVLLVTALLIRPQNKNVYRVLAAVPLLNFIVFFILNFTKGYAEYSVYRYGLHFIAALIYALCGITLAGRPKKAAPIIVSAISGLIFFLCSLIYVAGLSGDFHLGNFTQKDYAAAMEDLINEMEENYVLSDYKQIDFDALRNEYIPRAEAAQQDNDRVAFALAVSDLCYEFHDGHVRWHILDAELNCEVRDRRAGNDYGFSMIGTSDGSVVAILTDEGSEAYRSGLRDGFIITDWNGTDINEAMEDIRCVEPDFRITRCPIAENEDFFRPAYLAGQGGDTVTVGFIDDQGEHREITAASIGSYYERLAAAIEPITGNKQTEFAYACMLDDHCGYLCIPEESYDTASDILGTLNGEYPEIRDLIASRIDELKASGMDRLIIDLRGNAGGYDVIDCEIVSLFSSDGITWYNGFRNNEDLLVRSDRWNVEARPDGRYSDIPVVVLTNAGCASAGDILAYQLSQCDNVTTMGMTTTWGSAQGLGGYALLTDGFIEIQYPIIATLNEDDSVCVDAGSDRVGSFELDQRIPLTRQAADEIYVLHNDYELQYALDYINGI